MIRPEQERVRQLLTEAVTLLCRNSLQFEEEVMVEGLIGITLDKRDILLVSIHETVQQTLREVTSSVRSAKEPIASPSPGKRKRRKRSQDSDSDASPPPTPTKKPAPSMTDDDDDSRPDPEPRLNMKVKKESPEDDEDHEDRKTSLNERDGRSIHPAHDSTSRGSQMTQNSENSSGRVKQEPSGSSHSTDSAAQPAPNQQTLPTDAVRVKEEIEEGDECYVIDSDDEDMSNSSASNSMSLNMLENQLQLASQNWASVDDGSGFDLSNLTQQQQQNWQGQFDMSGMPMPQGGGNQSFMGTPQPGTSQDAQRKMCPFCQRQFTRPDHLRRHIREVHMRMQDFRCPFCARLFSQKTNMEAHIKRRHPGQAQACPLCSKVCASQEDLQQHQDKVHATYVPP